MKSRILLTLLLAFTLTFSVLAKDITQAQAEKAAVNFFYERANIFSNAIDYYDISIKELWKVDNAYYVVNFENGWVLVAGDDAMTPVLGYNYEGRFVEKEYLDYNVRSYLQHFSDQIEFIREHQITANKEVMDQWNHYLEGTPESLEAFRGNRDQVGPLLTATWNQDYPYNILCPEDDQGPGGHVYAGCVATAMSLVMHYWRYPLQGSGSHSYYQYPYGTLSANFGESYYDFDAMQDVIDGENPWEVAEISYHAGIAVDMDYAPDGSGAYSADVPFALETYFNYDNASIYVQKSGYSTATWINMMVGDLDLGRPIYYSGRDADNGGHAFVCDGYNSDDYFHYNFGWGGSANGFYTLSSVGGFYYNQAMVYHIYPDDPNYPYIPEEQVDLTSPSGSFTDGSGPVENYPSDWSGSWLINPQTETDSVVDITLSFIQFNTASSDYVRVYDGASTDDPLLGEFSGTDVPGSITSSGNKLLITFTTTGTGEGFKAEYNSHRPTYCQAQQVYADPSGTVTDGSGSFNYNGQTSCIFIIQHPEGVNYSLDFTEFETEEGKDKLTIYDGDQNEIAELSGTELPEPMELATDMVFLVWTTNKTVQFDGWSLNYTIDGVGIDESFEYDNLQIYPNPANDRLHVAFDIEKSQQLEVRLINMNGQVVREDISRGQNGHYENTFDVRGLTKGVYVLSIISDKGKMDKKIVLK